MPSARTKAKSKKKVCGVPGCREEAVCWGMCHNHQEQARTSGKGREHFVKIGWATPKGERSLFSRELEKAEAIQHRVDKAHNRKPN